MAATRTLPGRKLGRRSLLPALTAAAVSALAVASLAGSVTGPRRAAPASAPRRSTLPLAAQTAISARIGASDPEFSARRSRNGFSLHGGGISALLSARGARVAGLTMTLAGLGRGEQIARAHAPTLSASRNVVAYRYPGASAWYAAGPLGIEQGFTIARPPGGAGTRAPLTLALALGGPLWARPAAGGLDFLDRSGATLRYGGLEAVDATGRPLAATLAFAHRRLLIRIRDAGARYPVRIDPLFQLGAKITVGDAIGAAALFGSAVAVSADGNTAVIGGPGDNNQVGAAWIFVRTGSTWTEQQKLVATGTSGQAQVGYSVALSSDGNTALIGADSDGAGAGAAYVFTRSGTAWTQQAKLTGDGTVGSGEVGAGYLGFSVALAASGNLALVGAPHDNSYAGAVWTFGRAGSSWSQLGSSKLVAPDAGAIWFGVSVAVSGVGTTALVGATLDDSAVGAAFVYTLSGVTWTEQAKLTGGGNEIGEGYFGDSVALSADAGTALVGGFTDDNSVGAAWVYTNSAWSQPGLKLVPSDESAPARFATRVALSSDGSRALIGGYLDANGVGAAWTFSRSGSTYTQDAGKLTGGGEVGDGDFGFALGLSGDGSTALVGAPQDNGDDGALWSFGAAPPTCTNVSATTAVGGGTTTLTLQCTGPVGASISYAIVRGPAHGALGPIDQGTGSVTYTPPRGYTGTDQFTYDATDADGSSNAATATIAIPSAALRLNPTIAYTFHASRSGTSFSSLYLTGVPRAASVRAGCRGRRCPFTARVEHVPGRAVCHGTGRRRRCRREPPPRSGTVTLTRLFHHRELGVGTHLTIDVTETGAIGKVYVFTMRRSRAPALTVSCLAPGSDAPGRGC